MKQEILKIIQDWLLKPVVFIALTQILTNKNSRLYFTNILSFIDEPRFNIYFKIYARVVQWLICLVFLIKEILTSDFDWRQLCLAFFAGILYGTIMYRALTAGMCNHDDNEKQPLVNTIKYIFLLRS